MNNTTVFMHRTNVVSQLMEKGVTNGIWCFDQYNFFKGILKTINRIGENKFVGGMDVVIYTSSISRQSVTVLTEIGRVDDERMVSNPQKYDLKSENTHRHISIDEL